MDKTAVDGGMEKDGAFSENDPREVSSTCEDRDETGPFAVVWKDGKEYRIF